MNDPIFFCSEVKLLRRLKLEVISENLECKLKCQVHTSHVIISCIEIIIKYAGAHHRIPPTLSQAADEQPALCQLVSRRADQVG